MYPKNSNFALTMEQIITTYPLGDGIEAFVVTRGRVDVSDSYSGINVCHYVHDDPAHVRASREEVCRQLGIGADALVVPRQIHSADVAVLIGGASSPDGVDAVVTGLSDVAIGVSTADCVPVVMADASSGLIAAAHAGWRGALAGIVDNTLDAMVAYGASLSETKVFIGPCICQACFEVGEEVAELFPADFVSRAYGTKPHVDLAAYVLSQLAAHGVPESAIQGPIDCTRCNPRQYFSARRLGIHSGRTFTGIIRHQNAGRATPN